MRTPSIPTATTFICAGVIELEAGNCDVAVPLFRTFLRDNPPLVDVEAAQDQLARCEEAQPQPEPAPPPADPPPPAAAATPQPPLPADERSPRRDRWWTDPAGGGLFGSGLFLVAAGVGMLVGAAVSADATRADTAGDYRQGVARARGLNAAGIATATIGTGLVVGGIVRWAIVARRARR